MVAAVLTSEQPGSIILISKHLFCLEYILASYSMGIFETNKKNSWCAQYNSSSRPATAPRTSNQEVIWSLSTFYLHE
jgi:hypothetical protein